MDLARSRRIGVFLIVRHARTLPGHSARHDLIAIMSPFTAQGRNYGRSMVIARQGIAATSQALASQAAAQILARGGSAVDAAIAANAVLAVIEPMKCGPGGDLFVIHWEAATGKLTGLNASGPAPHALSPEFLAAAGFQDHALRRHPQRHRPGRRRRLGQDARALRQAPVEGSVSDAIAYADEGFPVAGDHRETWAEPPLFAKIQSNPNRSASSSRAASRRAKATSFAIPDMARAFDSSPQKAPTPSTKAKSPPPS